VTSRRTDSVNESFERRHRSNLEWTFERFNDDVAMPAPSKRRATAHGSINSSNSEIILFGHAADISPRRSIRVTNRARLVAQLTGATTPGADADRGPAGSERCCELRKVSRSEGRHGQISWDHVGERVDAPSRTNMKTLLWERNSIVKVNRSPRGRDTTSRTTCRHDCARAPTVAQGYASIGAPR